MPSRNKPTIDRARREVDAWFFNAEEPAPALTELLQQDDQTVIRLARDFIHSDDSLDRCLAYALLRGAGDELESLERTSTPVVRPLVLNALGRESVPEVLRWVVSAAGYHHLSEGLTSLQRLASHDDPVLRAMVASALPGLSTPQNIESVVKMLELMLSDDSEDVRWNALWGLFLLEVGAPQVGRAEMGRTNATISGAAAPPGRSPEPVRHHVPRPARQALTASSGQR